MTNVPFLNSITNELSKRKLKSNVVANAILDISVGNDKLDNLLTLQSNASEIDNVVEEANGFINTDNPYIKLSYGKTSKALTKAFDAATHTIAVKIGDIYDVALDGTMKVILKEGGTNLTRELLISGHWDGYSATKQWIAGSVKENTAQSTPLECKFAKDATSIYVILGAIEARGTLKVAVSDVMTNFIDANPMTMEIVSLDDLTELTVDLTKSDNLVGITSSASEIDNTINMIVDSETTLTKSGDSYLNGNVVIGHDLQVVGKIKATSINFSGLPTSTTDLTTGDVWNDGGTIKII